MENVLKKEPVTIQQSLDVNRRFGTHECVPYAHVGAYPVGRTRQAPIERPICTLAFLGQLHGCFFGKKSVLSVLCINSIVFEVENPGWVIYTYLVQIALIPGGTAPCHWIVFIINTAKGGIFFGILNFEGREQNLPQRLPCRP